MEQRYLKKRKRRCIGISDNVYDKIKYISVNDRRSIADLIEIALETEITRYEKKHGEIKVIHEEKGEIQFDETLLD